ncbi:hypothetical protein ml_314 [Mollivirus sibericum]|uniref:hypothetical protein n=1 Tax=Mollivirus sibericum TaxID=1678078 RepID=UPI0006B2E582|nr:hypothetical protein ml_314 [Mollivirus sibericum]ALD62116.1 hypothetical protein ml_314 [Mollivirus sibericum]
MADRFSQSICGANFARMQNERLKRRRAEAAQQQQQRHCGYVEAVETSYCVPRPRCPKEQQRECIILKPQAIIECSPSKDKKCKKPKKDRCHDGGRRRHHDKRRHCKDDDDWCEDDDKDDECCEVVVEKDKCCPNITIINSGACRPEEPYPCYPDSCDEDMWCYDPCMPCPPDDDDGECLVPLNRETINAHTLRLVGDACSGIQQTNAATLQGSADGSSKLSLVPGLETAFSIGSGSTSYVNVDTTGAGLVSINVPFSAPGIGGDSVVIPTLGGLGAWEIAAPIEGQLNFSYRPTADAAFTPISAMIAIPADNGGGGGTPGQGFLAAKTNPLAAKPAASYVLKKPFIPYKAKKPLARKTVGGGRPTAFPTRAF